MRVKVLATLIALALAAPSARAVDPPNFDFLGFADLPASIGGSLVMRSVLTNNGVVPTPITLDFTNNQYTLVVTGTWASGSLLSSAAFNPASIEIWEDPIGGGTAANYASPATFTDGTLILGGVFSTDLTRLRFTTTLGNFSGTITFNSGTRLGDLPTPVGWPFVGGWSRAVTIPPGYDEQWDGKIDLSTVGVDKSSWGGVKGLFD
jgi:hypothetical protein